MPFDTDALRAFMTNRRKRKDEQLLDDIYERLERGELSVSGLLELLRMRKMAGSEVTMQDLRHVLKVTYGVTFAAIWFAYSVGVANASELFSPHSKAATLFG